MKIKMLAVAMCVGLTLSTTTWAVDPFTVLRVSMPLMVSGSAGIRLGDHAEGVMRPAMQVEAGVGGGRIAIGLDNTGEAGIGYGMKAAIMQTWLKPVEIKRDQTFLGLEGELSIRQLIVSVGGYRLISSGDDNWMASVGLGFFF